MGGSQPRAVTAGVLKVLQRQARLQPDQQSTTPAIAPRPALPGRPRIVQRKPADFATTPAVKLPSDRGFWGGFTVTPWDAIQDAIRAYAALDGDKSDARTAALVQLQSLIASWAAGRKVNDGDQARADALKTLKVLIGKEHLELMAPRFQGDDQLGFVVQGWKPLRYGDDGLSVTRVQQALADTSHLKSSEVTGTYGPSTVAAVKGFQRAGGIPESGIVDQLTILELQRIFRGHSVEKTLAMAPDIEAKSTPGEFAWGSAPDALSVGTRKLKKLPEPVVHSGVQFISRPDDDQVDVKAALGSVKTSQPADPQGVLPTFVSDLPEGSYESRLKKLVLALAQKEYKNMAEGMAAKRAKYLLGWDHIQAVAARAKQVTDAVFGKFAAGPPLIQGAGIHDAWADREKKLQDDKNQIGAANFRVNKLITGDEQVRVLDRAHGAIQTRPVERAIVERVQQEVVQANWKQLLETHKAWPAFSAAGQVYVQRVMKEKDDDNRDLMWKLFQTVVHEYLHTLEHSRYRAYRGMLDQQDGDFTLREGVVDYFTVTVLESVNYDNALRVLVEGKYSDFFGFLGPHQIPKYEGYSERANAEKLAGLVGARNVMAAFFLGDVEKIGYTA